MKEEDHLMDALLKEQARKREADEALLAGIESAMDGGSRKRVPNWRRALPLSIAALLAITAVGVFTLPNLTVSKARKTEVAVNERPGESNFRVTVEKKAAPVEEIAPADVMAVPADPFAATDEMAGLAETEGVKSMGGISDLAAGNDGFSDRGLAARSGGAGRPMEAAEATTDAMPPARREKVEMAAVAADATEAPGSLAAPGIELRKRSDVVREEPSRDNYGQLTDQPWKSAWEDALSTFSIDVDTASYSNLRRMIREGRSIQPDAVRIEEIVNYFDYRYPAPEGESAFRVQSLLATCPWEKDHLLARVSIKGREVAKNARPASNLVFLIDVSGSMQSPDKLPMLKRAMRVLIDELDERDRVGMVVYAGTEGVVLPPTRLDEAGKSKAVAALAKLEAGGSTNGGAGLRRAYRMALENMQPEGVNRVILASDGDFNVGTTGQGELVELVKERASKGVSLSVLGFGTGNLNDAMMEAVTNDGNGNYFYIDGDREAKRVFLDKLSGTLVTIAKDVKIQVEFNPGKVKAYRLIGYANRVLRHQDFNNDKVDAGDIGAGHTVTAFYEIVPVGVDAPGVGQVDELRYQRPEGRRELVASDDWFTLKLRYKHPEGEVSKLIETPVKGGAVDWQEAGNDFRMASAAALFGMKLRKMEEVAEVGWSQVIEMAKPTLAEDPQEQRAEFVELLRLLD